MPWMLFLHVAIFIIFDRSQDFSSISTWPSHGGTQILYRKLWTYLHQKTRMNVLVGFWFSHYWIICCLPWARAYCALGQRSHWVIYTDKFLNKLKSLKVVLGFCGQGERKPQKLWPSCTQLCWASWAHHSCANVTKISEVTFIYQQSDCQTSTLRSNS